MISYQDLERLLTGLEAPSWEPGLDSYRDQLIALNAILTSDGRTRAEGNLFYHAVIEPLDRPDPLFIGKRRNFAVFASAGETMLEIGVNAGHSLLLALAVNPRLRYVGIDLAVHPYSRRCLDWLRREFGDRIELLEGNSREVLPALLARGRRNFDLIHIDGGHHLDVAYSDLVNALELARAGGLILFDDTNISKLEALCEWFEIAGYVSRVTPTRIWEPGMQTLLRVAGGR